MIKVIFYIVLILPGQQPRAHTEEVADKQTCLAMVADALEQLSPPAGGKLDIGCARDDSGVKS